MEQPLWSGSGSVALHYGFTIVKFKDQHGGVGVVEGKSVG